MIGPKEGSGLGPKTSPPGGLEDSVPQIHPHKAAKSQDASSLFCVGRPCNMSDTGPKSSEVC